MPLHISSQMQHKQDVEHNRTLSIIHAAPISITLSWTEMAKDQVLLPAPPRLHHLETRRKHITNVSSGYRPQEG